MKTVFEGKKTTINLLFLSLFVLFVSALFLPSLAEAHWKCWGKPFHWHCGKDHPDPHDPPPPPPTEINIKGKVYFKESGGPTLETSTGTFTLKSGTLNYFFKGGTTVVFGDYSGIRDAKGEYSACVALCLPYDSTYDVAVYTITDPTYYGRVSKSGIAQGETVKIDVPVVKMEPIKKKVKCRRRCYR